MLVLLTLLVALTARVAAQAPAPVQWEEARWQGERALRSTSAGWQAIVSLERGRLVFFGRPDGDNLLFAPATKEDRNGWGGHRVWLGPQAAWDNVWPPPDAWERGAAPSPSPQPDGTLRLGPQSAGAGWPTFERSYRWFGRRLVCGVTVEANGTRPAQVIQILQFPASALVRALLRPESAGRARYVGLPAGGRRGLEVLPQPPPHATVNGDIMHLRHRAQIEKLGFPPTPLFAQTQGVHVKVSRGREEGHSEGVPDEGFSTHVYLGGPEPFIELEQLSHLWSAGTSATFELVLEPVSE